MTTPATIQEGATGRSGGGVVKTLQTALNVHAAGEVLADICGVPGPGGS